MNASVVGEIAANEFTPELMGGALHHEAAGGGINHEFAWMRGGGNQPLHQPDRLEAIDLFGPAARSSGAITLTPWAAAITRESASASSSEVCSQPQLRQTTSQPPSRAGRTRSGCWGKEKMTAVMVHNPVADRGARNPRA